jgi:chemotaxis protein MotB
MLRVLCAAIPVALLLATGCAGPRNRERMLQLEESLAQARAANRSLAGRVAAAERRSAELRERVDRTVGDLEAVNNRLASVKRERDALSEKRDALAARCRKLEALVPPKLPGAPAVLADQQGGVEITGLAFAFAGGQLKKDSLQAARKAAQVLKGREGTIYVDGHTDNVPVENPKTQKLYIDNLGLSLARAAAVARAFIDAGISPARLVVRGFGASRPVAKNDTPAGRAKNRRVEIYLAPPAESTQSQ